MSKFSIGQAVVVQFGNNMGRERAEVRTATVLATREHFGTSYLVRAGNLIGVATVPANDMVAVEMGDEHIVADLHSTSALVVGQHGSEESCRSLLGFREELQAA